MSKRVCKSFMVLIGILLSLGWGIVQAEGLVMTSPPRETKAAGEKLYGPVAKYLTQVLGVTVTYKYQGNWLSYQREMRDDAYDIVFDGPHFISWRQVHLQNEALVKLPGHLEFLLVVRADDKKVNTLEDLIGKKICGISPPNLSSLAILDVYRNPVRQPVIIGERGGMPGVAKAFKAGYCEAAIFRGTFYRKKLTEADRAGLKILFRSKPFPSQGITASRRVSAADRAKIRVALTTGKGIQVTAGILKRFGGKKVKAFVPTNSAEYKGYNTLLEGVIFGW